MFTRVAAIAGVAALSLACGSGPKTSPFFLWSVRPGMPLDSVEQFFRRRDELGQSQQVWERCDRLDGGARRCVRRNGAPWGQFEVVAAADGRVVYLAFAPGVRDVIFDDSVSAMQRRWVRGKRVRMDPGGVSEENPVGIAQMRSGRWRALMTFDGKRCENTQRPRPCPALFQLVDWSDGQKYADMSVPR